MRRLAIITLAATLIAAAPADTLKSKIRSHLDTVLLDGQSARYIWPEVKSPRVYCGFVNAKNRLGGYTGYRLFYVQTNGSPIKATFDSDTLALASMVCDEAGYPLSPA